MQATKPSDVETVLTRKFAAPRQTVFEAMTRPNHLLHWLKAGNMSLAKCEVDLRAGGSFRYVFERPGGVRIEVRGAYHAVKPPQSLSYTESYDFSPLKMLVTTALEEEGKETVFRQTLTYSTKEERDSDFDGVANSAAEAYANLDRYLESLR